MKKEAFVGLSSPIFYDYQNVAPKAPNDDRSSPNPVIENAIGLAIFYDEIWFVCESLCPASLRGQSNVKYLDKDLDPVVARSAVDILSLENENQSLLHTVGETARANFTGYWDAVKKAGTYWENEEPRMDNHTHGLNIFDKNLRASSNDPEIIVNDLECAKFLRMDLSLNTFNVNIYNKLYPNQFDPLAQAAENTICSNAIINCRVNNAISKAGPVDKIYDYASTSPTAKDFRRYIEDRSPLDAYGCFQQLSDEIDDHIARTLRKSSESVHPVKGIMRSLWSFGQGILIPEGIRDVSRWYLAQVKVPPDGAAAFLWDLQQKSNQ
ncbi:hypothetical protein [Marinobacter alexandrii]|uniref:hypothetical protein n=1 Tax=Marinobacter alexandrii TaxID=2570351 RepID=UPI001108E483|nr:hypothetical protein [Marinobacter alexandrii]